MCKALSEFGRFCDAQASHGALTTEPIAQAALFWPALALWSICIGGVLGIKRINSQGWRILEHPRIPPPLA